MVRLVSLQLVLSRIKQLIKYVVQRQKFVLKYFSQGAPVRWTVRQLIAKDGCK